MGGTRTCKANMRGVSTSNSEKREKGTISCLKNDFDFLRLFLKTLREYPLNKLKHNLTRLFYFLRLFLASRGYFLKKASKLATLPPARAGISGPRPK